MYGCRNSRVLVSQGRGLWHSGVLLTLLNYLVLKILHGSPSTFAVTLRPRETLDDAVAAAADDPAAVRTPYHAADALTSHDAMTCDFLRAVSFL